jgi:cytochrome P450
MAKVFRHVVSSRITSSDSTNKLDDYADIMKDLIAKTSTPEYKKLGITETTIMGQGVNLVLAGFDGISTIMTCLVYHLAKNEAAQERLYEEITSVIDGKYDGLIDYQTLSEMTYLTACISETARLYPIFIRPERVCNKDWECSARGIKIPKGVIVMIASYAANRNPELYDSPDEFIPERFMPQNKVNLNPYAFATFGFGHRSCMGMRFAYEAMRVAISHMLRKYRFVLRDDSRIKFKPGVLLIVQFDPVYLDVVERVNDSDS